MFSSGAYIWIGGFQFLISDEGIVIFRGQCWTYWPGCNCSNVVFLVLRCEHMQLLLDTINQLIFSTHPQCNFFYGFLSIAYHLHKHWTLFARCQFQTGYGYLLMCMMQEHIFRMRDYVSANAFPWKRPGPLLLTYNVWYEITYPFLNFNGATVEV